MDRMPPSLDDLRRRIDEIDDRLQDLVIERAEVVAAIGAQKHEEGVALLRPGREALILRRLVARHKGPFSRAVLVRLWRELISGTVMIQGEFAVAVSALEEMPDYWDLARDHFGSHAPMIAFHSAGEVLRALAEGRVMVGVVPMPTEGERSPWWPLLAVAGASAPKVMARLPFGGRGNARGDGGFDALVIGRATADPTGEDRSLIAIETVGELSRARLIGALTGAGLEVTLSAVHEPSGESAWHLIEIDDMVGPGEARFDQALKPLEDKVARVSALGSYAKPFAAAALAARGDGR
jgi:chorismate mutase/prephenate dehydratase